MSVAAERSIYLIKHAEPLVRPDVAAEEWAISPHGAEQSRALAKAGKRWRLASVYCSYEPKAASTALMIADALGLQARIIEGAEELRIGGWVANADEFNERVRHILEDPIHAPPGAETAGAAAARFAAAISAIASGHLPAAIVSHGRILAAYLSQTLGEPDQFEIWKSIPFAGVARLDITDKGPQLAEPFAPLPELEATA